MAKRETKADLILGEARRRVDRAEVEVRSARLKLHTAEAALEAHTESLVSLEHSLAPTPRKTAKKKEAPPPTLLPEDGAKEPMCVVCGHGVDYQDHFQPSPAYHPFASSVRTAGRRSSRKGSATQSEVTTANEAEDAIAVGATGD
jgi:hypothetical protein